MNSQQLTWPVSHRHVVITWPGPSSSATCEKIRLWNFKIKVPCTDEMMLWFISEWKLGQFQNLDASQYRDYLALSCCVWNPDETLAFVFTYPPLFCIVLSVAFSVIVIHYCWRISDWIPWLQPQHSIQTMLLRKIPLHEVERMSVFNRKKTRTLFWET